MSFTNLSVEEFKSKMSASDMVILDVRTLPELTEGEIPGHQMINYNSPDFAEKVNKLDKSRSYLVYCRSGRRSADACNIMADLGFSSLYNLEGGINAWNIAE